MNTHTHTEKEKLWSSQMGKYSWFRTVFPNYFDGQKQLEVWAMQAMAHGQINISEKIEKLTANYLPTGIWNYSISWGPPNEFNLAKEPGK